MYCLYCNLLKSIYFVNIDHKGPFDYIRRQVEPKNIGVAVTPLSYLSISGTFLLYHVYFVFILDSCEQINSLDELCKTQFYKSIELPYAKIIPLLNHNIHDIFNAGQNDFLDVLWSQPLLREFSENIYDAFSTEYS